MQPNPIRVIAFCSLILGSFFVAKSVSIKTPKYVLHELLSFKVNKSRFFRKYINQKLDAITGFLFMFLGFALQMYLEVEALDELRSSPSDGFSDWWTVMGATVVIMVAITLVLNKVTRFFSGKIFVEHMRFMVKRHGYPLEQDESLVLELGKVMRIQRDDHDTIESYSEKVRAKMKLPSLGTKSPVRRPY